MKIFIELWKAKDAWKKLPLSERQTYVAQIGPVMEDLIKRGVVIEAWGINEDETPFASEYDFFAVTKLPSHELLTEFEAIVEGAGWYDYFDQVNVSGTAMTPEEVIGKMLVL
jgi:haloalkane dehalogenase